MLRCHGTTHIFRPDRQHRQNPLLPSQITVRFVKVISSSNELEILATSLYDSVRYPSSVFAWLYHQRWGVETILDHLKNHWEVERLSSGKTHCIHQDFHASIFLVTLETLLTLPAKAKFSEHLHQRPRKYAYALNRAISASTLAHHVLELLCDSHIPLEELLQRLTYLFQFDPQPVRPGRSNPRNFPTFHRALRHQRYYKKRWC